MVWAIDPPGQQWTSYGKVARHQPTGRQQHPFGGLAALEVPAFPRDVGACHSQLHCFSPWRAPYAYHRLIELAATLTLITIIGTRIISFYRRQKKP